MAARLVLTRGDMELLDQYVPDYDMMDADELAEKLTELRDWLASQVRQEFDGRRERRARAEEDVAVGDAKRQALPDMRGRRTWEAAAAPMAPQRGLDQAARRFREAGEAVADALEPIDRPARRASRQIMRWYHWLAYAVTACIVLFTIGAVTGIISHDTAAMMFARGRQILRQTHLDDKSDLWLDWDGTSVVYETRDGCVPGFYMLETEGGVITAPPALWPKADREDLQDRLYEGCHPRYATHLAINGYLETDDGQLWMGVHIPKPDVRRPNKDDGNDWVDVWTAAEWWGIDKDTLDSVPGMMNYPADIAGKSPADMKMGLIAKGQVFEATAQGATALPTAAIQPTQPPRPTNPPAAQPAAQAPTSPPAAQPAEPTQEPAAPAPAEATAEPPAAPEPTQEFATQVVVQPTTVPTPWPTSAPAKPADFKEPPKDAACGIYITCLDGRSNNPNKQPTQQPPPSAGAAPVTPGIAAPTAAPSGGGRKVANNGTTYDNECNALDWQYSGTNQPIPPDDFKKLAQCQMTGHPA